VDKIFYESFREFDLTIGNQRFKALLSIFLGKTLHLQLVTKNKNPAFFSETGFRSHFFGLIEKDKIAEKTEWIAKLPDEELIEIIKELFPNYQRFKKPLEKQLKLFLFHS